MAPSRALVLLSDRSDLLVLWTHLSRRCAQLVEMGPYSCCIHSSYASYTSTPKRSTPTAGREVGLGAGGMG